MLRKSENALKHIASELLAVMESYHYVTDNCHVIEEADILEGSCDTLVIYPLLTHSAKLLTAKEEGSLCRLIHSRDEIEDRCLTCTVGADKSVYLTFFDF